jgi:glycosyltransferase involved in cell wall biosynthesis
MYSISSNAMIVNEASPAAIASAVMALFHNRTLRHSIGDAGRDRVRSFFTVERQMAQYSELYRKAIALKGRGNTIN